jgi:hypothetical protein
MPDDREPEESTQAEIEQEAAREPDDPQTRREEVELDRMETIVDREGEPATAD